MAATMDDLLETLIQIQGYAQASAEAQHAQLAALAEIRALLIIEAAPEEEGEPPELVSVADLLSAIADDIEEAGTAAQLLAPDPGT